MASPEQGWSKLYDSFYSHPKFLKAGPIAGYIYFAGQSYCSVHETDGKIPKEATSGLLPAHFDARTRGHHIKALVDVELWHDRGDHYEQHDFCEMQRTSEERQLQRKQARERKKAQRVRDAKRNGQVADVTRDTSVTEPPMSRVSHTTEESRVVQSTTDVPPSSEGGPLDSEGPQQEQDHSNDEGPDHSPARAHGPSGPPAEDPIRDLPGAAERALVEKSPLCDRIRGMSGWFYGLAGHVAPETPKATAEMENETRKVVEIDIPKYLPDVPEEGRWGILKEVMLWIVEDAFWSTTVKAMGKPLRKVGDNGHPKWLNAFNQMQDAGVGAACSGGANIGPDGKPWTSLTPQRKRERNMEKYGR